jgi:hypothetical protein
MEILRMTIDQLKGFVAEEISKYHMEKLEYKVVPIGREKIEPELSDLLLFIRGNMGHLNKQSAESFKIFENTISKLPDYAIWKISPENRENMMTFRFMEVKYRTSITNLKKHKTKNVYYVNIKKEDDFNQLQVHKYINNLQNLYGISSNDTDNNKIDNIEFYLYIITIIDGKHVPLIGKVKLSNLSNYSDFYTYLYTPEQLQSEINIMKLWGIDYNTIAQYFMNNNKIDYMFSNEFLIPLIGKSNNAISTIINNHLENI